MIVDDVLGMRVKSIGNSAAGRSPYCDSLIIASGRIQGVGIHANCACL
jgi:hypothetical protein